MLRALAQERDITILISSHILEELSKLCTDFGIIHKGSLIKELSQEQLMQQCEKRLELVVDEPQKAMTVLDSMNIHDYEAVDPTHLHVYERLEDSMLINRELVNAGVLPREMKVNQEELESYFLNLTSGLIREIYAAARCQWAGKGMESLCVIQYEWNYIKCFGCRHSG